MKINSLKYISVILIIATITSFDAYLFDALNKSFGIPYLRYTFLYLFLLPGLFIIHDSLQKKTFKAPYLLYYLFFLCIHYYMETNLYGINYEPDLDLIRRTYTMFFAFMAMVNFGNTFISYIKLLKLFLLIIFLVSSLFYLGFLGVIDTGRLFTFDDGRTMSNWNLNVVSDLNVLGIYIVYLLDLHKVKIIVFKILIKPKYIMAYLLLILVFTATRGSMLLFIVGAIIYFKINFNKISASQKVLSLFIITILLIIFFSLNILGTMTDNIIVVDRLLNASYEEEGRYLQIIASWNNFINNFWIGTGYSNAAGNVFEGIGRSNFQYTQVLGAGGILLFIVYYTFIFKMFLGKLKNAKRLKIQMLDLKKPTPWKTY